MSETLEQRVRRVAKEDFNLGMVNAFAGDIVEMLDNRDAELASLRAERDEAVALLKELEWSASDEWGAYCPKCVSYFDMGEKHEDDCELDAFLSKFLTDPE